MKIPVGRTLRGYTSESVHKAVDELDERFQQQKRMLEAEIDRLECEIEERKRELQSKTSGKKEGSS